MNKIILFLLLIAAFVSGYLYLHSDNRLIHKQLERLSSQLNKEGDETGVESITAAAGVGKLFNDPCTLNIEEYEHQGSYPRKEIVQKVLMLRNQSSLLKVHLQDISIQKEGKKSAVVDATLLVERNQGSTAVNSVHELQLFMDKVSGTWLINGMVIVQVLER